MLLDSYFADYFVETNKLEATGGLAVTKWLKFEENSRHMPHPKKGLYKDIKREAKNINFDFHFIHGEKSWLKRIDCEKLFKELQKNEKIRSSFNALQKCDHQPTLTSPEVLIPVLKNILNKYD